MKASLTVNVDCFKMLAKKLQSPEIKNQIEAVANEKPVAALIAQAVADNFAKEGPGWAPLKPRTIRQSMSKKNRKNMKVLSDEDISKHEKLARGGGEDGAFRKILRKTNLLYKSVTTPGFSGSNKSGAVGSNIYKVENAKITWGTSLIYARPQNQGNPKKKVPARPFLVIRDEWMKKITMYVVKRYKEIIKSSLGTNSK